MIHGVIHQHRDQQTIARKLINFRIIIIKECDSVNQYYRLYFVLLTKINSGMNCITGQITDVTYPIFHLSTIHPNDEVRDEATKYRL